MDHKTKARRAKVRLAILGVVAAALVAGGGALAVISLDDDSQDRPSASASSPGKASASPGGSSKGPRKQYTPATARRVPVMKPRTSKDGIGVGFEHSGLGGTSAAISYWQDLDLLDDSIARKQWAAITSRDSQDSIDRGVSEVRRLREGVGLPPSGGTPAGLTFTTVVKAVRTLRLDDIGEVIEVWMVYDRYASSPKKPTDDDPLKDETVCLMLKWEAGDWKVTEEPRYTKLKSGPVAFDPDSPFAYQDQWREVARG
ncbi:hypothetical protein [Streptomyces syringium]|uniref:hypothetical protein n=1 Tax=Streptomyces syringium TaxID=76729 RepID=UPI0037CFAFCC